MQPLPVHATVSRNSGAPTQPRALISGAAAAKKLSLNKSTLSRYLKTFPELDHSESAGKTLVDLEELARHRAENVNLVKSGNHAGKLFEEPTASIFDEPSAPPAADPKNGSYAGARARFEEIRAKRAEREEAEALAHLVSSEAVADGIGEALIVLRDKLLSPDLDLCDRLANTSDPLEVMKALRDANRAALQKLTEGFEENAERGGTA